MSKIIFNTKQAVEYMKSRGYVFSPKTLEVWRSKKEGPNYKVVGRKNVFYEKAELDNFIEGRKIDTNYQTR